MIKYKVLWLEDESEKMDGFFDKAYQKEIELILVETFSELKNEILRKSKFYYDAIILDGFGLIESNEEKPSLKALQESINFINQHKNQEVFPYFILSGYLGEEEHKNVRDMIGSENIYYKTIDEEKLITNLKRAVDEKLETQLKFKYQQLIELCTNDFLGEDNFSRMLSIIKHIENHEKLTNSEDLLNPLRKIVEKVFEKLKDQGIIPDQILTEPGWINGSSLFLSNLHSNYEHLSEFIPPIVGENIHRLLNITHDASHVGGNLKLKSDQYIQSASSDYLYRSCTFLLFDILLWFKDFVENHPNKNQNLALWRKKILLEGIIEKDNYGNYFCGQHRLNPNYVEKNNNVGDFIIILEEANNTHLDTKNIYPKYASKYRKK